MSSSPRNRQLGPYVLGSRYKHSGELGRLYRARHAETGKPALVLEPTERNPEDAPLADWQLRVSSSVAPAYLALEVEGAPSTAEAVDAEEELEVMLDDWRHALAQALRRPETLRHLRGSRPPARRERTDWRPGVFGAALAAGLAALIVHSTPTMAPELGSEFARAQLAPAAFDAGVGDVTGVVLTDTTEGVPIALARPMPQKPFERVQKQPPCNPALEEEHFGGCWVETKRSAPCPDQLYEYDGKCYLPAAKPTPKPTSIFR